MAIKDGSMSSQHDQEPRTSFCVSDESRFHRSIMVELINQTLRGSARASTAHARNFGRPVLDFCSPVQVAQAPSRKYATSGLHHFHPLPPTSTHFHPLPLRRAGLHVQWIQPPKVDHLGFVQCVQRLNKSLDNTPWPFPTSVRERVL